MKKIILTILCVCSFLFDAHAQVYDITFTKEGATAATYTAKNATLVTFSYNGDVPTVEFTSGQSAGSDAKYLEHTVRYNITFGKATSAINSGSGDPTTDNNGTVWAGAKPRKTASQDPQEPTVTGPTLVIKTTGGYGTYTLSSENTTIKLKYDGTYYTVNSSDSDYPLSDVEAIYYVDPHRGEKTKAVAPTSSADGNIDYWTCSKCKKHFGDEACTKEVANNSWVRALVAGTISWDDSEDADSKRPESVTIYLFAGSEDPIKEQIITAKDNWTYSFTDLPRYNGESKITYSISENKIDDYTTAVDGYNITNTHIHAHADKDNNGYCDKEKCKAEMDVMVALSKVGDRYYTSFGAPYIYNVKNAADDLKVYVATSLSEDVLTMTQVAKAAIPADMGVVIVGTSSSSPETMTATIAHAEEADVVSDLLFATKAGMETAGNVFFSAVNGIVGFYAYNTTLGAVPAGKAYLQLPTEEAGAKVFTMAFEDEATSIGQISPLGESEGAIYNLNGQRLSAPQKGLNIINGKKVMVK